MRTTATVALAATATVLIVGIILVLFWLAGAGGRDRFSSLSVAPRDAFFYLVVNTDPASSQWVAFNDVLEVLNAKGPLSDRLNEILEEFDLVWEEDILPLAGEEAYLALVDIDALEEGRGWMAGIQLRNTDRARDIILDVARQEAENGDGEVIEDEYLGTTVYYTEREDFFEGPVDSGAFAFLDGLLVVAADRRDLEDAIDAATGRAPTARENERLQELRERQEEDFILWGYADLAPLWDRLEEEPVDPTLDVDPTEIIDELRGSTDRMSFVLRSHRTGFSFDVSVIRAPDFDPDEGFAPDAVFDTAYAGMVPEDTLVFLAGYDLYNQVYGPLREAIERTTLGQEGDTVDDVLRDFEDEIGFNVEDDLLALMTGEFALAFNVRDLAQEPEVEILSLLDVTDARRIERTMTRLGDYLEDQELIQVRETRRRGVYRWEEFGAGGGDAFAWTVTRRSLAMGFPDPVVEAFLDGAQPSLADSPDWQATFDLLPGERTFIAYVSLARLIEELRELEGVEEDFEEVMDGELTFDDLAPIRSVGIVGTLLEDGWGQSMVVLVKE